MVTRRSAAGEVTRAISTEAGGAPRWFRDGSELFYRSGDGVFAVEISTDGTFERGLPTRLRYITARVPTGR